MTKRYNDMGWKEQDQFVADVIDFFEDDDSMNGKTTADLIEAFPEYDDRDLKMVRKALVVTKVLYQNRPARDALHIATKAGSTISRLLRER